MGRIDCDACGGYGERTYDTVDGYEVEDDCRDCAGIGSFAAYGPLTLEEEEAIEVRRVASEASLAKWAMFACTHCGFYCDAWAERGPQACHSCPDGIVMLMRDLQAAARGSLLVRRVGDRVEPVEPVERRDEIAGIRAVLDAACDDVDAYPSGCVVAAMLAVVDGEDPDDMDAGPVRDLLVLAHAATGGPLKAPSLEVRYIDGSTMLDDAGNPTPVEGQVFDEILATGARVHLEGMSDYNPDAPEGERDASWWMSITVGDEVVHVWLGADAPIWTRVERWAEPPPLHTTEAGA